MRTLTLQAQEVQGYNTSHKQCSPPFHTGVPCNVYVTFIIILSYKILLTLAIRTDTEFRHKTSVAQAKMVTSVHMTTTTTTTTMAQAASGAPTVASKLVSGRLCTTHLAPFPARVLPPQQGRHADQAQHRAHVQIHAKDAPGRSDRHRSDHATLVMSSGTTTVSIMLWLRSPCSTS